MIRTFKTLALAGALAMAVSPVLAQSITLPFIGDPTHPDLDPLHIFTPAPAAAPAAPAAKPMVKHHHHHKKMMKKPM